MTTKHKAQLFKLYVGQLGMPMMKVVLGHYNFSILVLATYVKHFIGRVHGYTNNDYSIDDFVAGILIQPHLLQEFNLSLHLAI
jgi:hypothetical protein